MIRHRSASTVNLLIGRPLITLKSLVTLKTYLVCQKRPQTELDGWRFNTLYSRHTCREQIQHRTEPPFTDSSASKQHAKCSNGGHDSDLACSWTSLLFQGDGRLRRYAPLRDGSTNFTLREPVLPNQHTTFLVQTRRVERTLH